MSRNSRNRRKTAAGLAGLGSAAAIMGAGIAAMATGSVPTAAPQADHSGVQSATLTQATTTTTTGDNAGFATKPPVPSTTTSTSSSPPSNTTPVIPGVPTTQSDSKAPNPNDVLPGGGFFQSLLAPTSIPGAGNAGFSTISTTAPFGVGFNSVMPGGINFLSTPSGGVGFSVPFWTGNTSPDDNKPTGFSITPFLNENFAVPIQNGGGGGITVPDTITFPGNGGPVTSTLGSGFGNFLNGIGGSGPSFTYTAPSWVTQLGGYPGATTMPSVTSAVFAPGQQLGDFMTGLTQDQIARANAQGLSLTDGLLNSAQATNNNLAFQFPQGFANPASTAAGLNTGTATSVDGIPGFPLNASIPPVTGTITNAFGIPGGPGSGLTPASGNGAGSQQSASFADRFAGDSSAAGNSPQVANGPSGTNNTMDTSGVGSPLTQVTPTLSPDGAGTTVGAIQNVYTSQTTGAALPVSPDAAVNGPTVVGIANSIGFIPGDATPSTTG